MSILPDLLLPDLGPLAGQLIKSLTFALPLKRCT